MVRGPHHGDGARSTVYYLDSAGLVPPPRRPRPLGPQINPLADEWPAGDYPAAGTPKNGPWGGAGGRWLLWPLRAVLWGTLLVIAFRGVAAIVSGQALTSAAAPAAPAAPVRPAASQFPVSLAEAYAADFGRVYLNFTPQTRALREEELQAYLPGQTAAADPDLGWNGAGEMFLQSEQVAGIAVQDRQHAVITLLAQVDGQLMELGVPIAASGPDVVVSGEPAWLPAPAPISPPATAVGGSDPAAQSQLMNELPAFFQAYGGGDSATLRSYLAPGASVTSLGGALAFDSIADLSVPAGGTTRTIYVTVIWQVPEQAGSAVAKSGMASKLQMTYCMSVVDLRHGKWYVKEIGASTEAVGAR
jgi:hypothetical protein